MWQTLRTSGTQIAVMGSRLAAMEKQCAQTVENLQQQATEALEQVARMHEIIQGSQNVQWATSEEWRGWKSKWHSEHHLDNASRCPSSAVATLCPAVP